MDLFKTKKKKEPKTAVRPQPENYSRAHAAANGNGAQAASTPTLDADGWEERELPQAQSNDTSNSRHKASVQDTFTKLLEGNVPLAQMRDTMTKHALELEADINDYLNCNNAETQEKYLIAQDVLRHGLERSPELIDEAYLQIIKQMQGKTTTCVRGWELLLLLACASRPTARYLEGINTFVHASANATTQWPTTTSILAKRTWSTLKHNIRAGRRVNVPLVGEIASVLNNKTLKVQVTFVDGSNKWLSYDWTTTVSGAVEQLAADIGLKNYQDYTLFEARKVPKKLDKDGNFSTATLPPDSYLLLEDHRRIADVVHDYVARGAENKLLLKRRRFDSAGADFSKPQFIALTEAHQAAMDEKIAEVANLTLRLREMSGQVMWFENIQNEKSTEIGQLQAEVQQLRANLASRSLSSGHDEDNAALIRERDALMQERDELMDQVKQLKAGDLITEELSDKHNNRVIYETPTDKQQGFEELKRQLNMRNAEILNIKAAYQNADRILMSSDHQHEAELAQMEMILAEKTKDVEDLNQLVNKLTSQLDLFDNELAYEEIRGGDWAFLTRSDKVPKGRFQDDRGKSILATWNAGVRRSYSSPLDAALARADSETGKQLSTMQEAFQRQAAVKEDLEAELDRMQQDFQEKEEQYKKQEKAWRIQVNAAKAETASMKSRLKANDAALVQATGDLEQLHAESGQLRADLETKEQENESLQARLRDAEFQGFLGESDSGRSTAAADLVIETLRAELDDVAQERDSAIQKLSVIQTFMSGAVSPDGAENYKKGAAYRRDDQRSGGQPAGGKQTRQSLDNKASLRQSFDSTSDLSEQRLNMRNKRKAQKIIVDPLAIGRDPRRESIGGASAPVHLRNAAPLRVLPEDKRQYGTRHPLFTPSYVQQLPLLAATSSRREEQALRKEAAAMLSAADAKRRNFKQELEELVGEDTRPAPAAVTTAQVTDNINRGTHLLGLLNNRMISASQEGLYESGGQQDPPKGRGTYPDSGRSLRAENQAMPSRKARGAYPSGSDFAPQSIMASHPSLTSTQSEPDMMRPYQNVAQAQPAQ